MEIEFKGTKGKTGGERASKRARGRVGERERSTGVTSGREES